MHWRYRMFLTLIGFVWKIHIWLHTKANYHVSNTDKSYLYVRKDQDASPDIRHSVQKLMAFINFTLQHNQVHTNRLILFTNVKDTSKVLSLLWIKWCLLSSYKSSLYSHCNASHLKKKMWHRSFMHTFILESSLPDIQLQPRCSTEPPY